MGHNNLLGVQFGLLTVISSEGPDKWRNWQWKVRCQCGKEWEQQANNRRNTKGDKNNVAA